MAKIINLSQERNDPTPDNVVAMLEQALDRVKGQGTQGPARAILILDYDHKVTPHGEAGYTYQFLSAGIDIDRTIRLFEQIKLNILS